MSAEHLSGPKLKARFTHAGTRHRLYLVLSVAADRANDWEKVLPGIIDTYSKVEESKGYQTKEVGELLQEVLKDLPASKHFGVSFQKVFSGLSAEERILLAYIDKPMNTADIFEKLAEITRYLSEARLA